MRSLIRLALITPLAALDVAPDAIVSGDADSVHQRPFVNLQWSETTPGMSYVRKRSLVVWVHDEPADYTRVDAIVKKVRTTLESLAASMVDTGGWFHSATWLTDSSDLRNDERGTILRTSTYSVVGSGM
jgi:hypothetical protein